MKLLAAFVLSLAVATTANAKTYLIGTRYGMTAVDLGVVTTAGADSLSRISVYKVELDPVFAELLPAISPFVTFVEEDVLVMPVAVPSDPLYAQQWHWPHIGMPAAWDLTVGSASMVIDVADTGVNAVPDLAARLLPGRDIAHDSDDAHDLIGHGTRVAGIIGAVTNNSIGVAGGTWQGHIRSLRIAQSAENEGAFISDMAKAVIYSADHGGKVVNLSYGGIGAQSVNEAAKYLMSKGGMLVWAAGNCGCDSTVAESPYTLGVGATCDEQDRLAGFSSRHAGVDISAPGCGILTTDPDPNRYVGFGGTSAATPVTSAVVGLMFASNSRARPEDVMRVIQQTALDLGRVGHDTSYGAGRVRAGKAVQAIRGFQAPTRTPTRVTSPTPSRTPTKFVTRTPTPTRTPTRTPRPTPTPTKRPCRVWLSAAASYTRSQP